MKLSRCPVCHANIHLDALIQDESGRELLRLLAKNYALYRPIVAYLTLFRPEKRDLSNDRALALALETIALESNQEVLKAALLEAVEAARNKQVEGNWTQPKDHGWLKAFLKNARVAQGMPAKPARKKAAQISEDIPHEQVRAMREREPGMPQNIKAEFDRILKGRNEETEAQRDERLRKSREAADEALRRAEMLKQ
jgi:hypothetical protein